MTDYAGYAVLMTLATTTLVKFHLVNMWASTSEYLRNMPGWVAKRYQKRIGTYEVVGRYDPGQWFAFLVGLGLWLGWVLYYATTYNATATNTWHPTDQWTVGFQGIFFAYTFAGLSYKFFFYKALRRGVFGEEKNTVGPMGYISSLLGKPPKQVNEASEMVTDWMWGWVHWASWGFLEAMTALSFVAYCVLTLVMITATYPTTSTTVANSGYPDNTYAATAQAGWGLLASGFILMGVFSVTGWTIAESWVPSWLRRKREGVYMQMEGRVIPYAVLDKFKPHKIPAKHLSRPYEGKKTEYLKVGTKDPRVLEADHPEAPLYALARRGFQNVRDFDVKDDTLFYPDQDGGVGVIAKHAVAQVQTGDDVEPDLQEAAEYLARAFRRGESAEDDKYLKAVVPTQVVTADIYGWGRGLALHQTINGIVMTAFNVLDLSACIAFMGQGSLGFILYFITTGWPTFVAVASERGFWWELVAWHKLVGVTIIQINQLSLLPASAFVLEGVWRRTLGSVALPNLIVTQQVLAALGCTLAIFSFVWGVLLFWLPWARDQEGDNGVKHKDKQIFHAEEPYARAKYGTGRARVGPLEYPPLSG